MGEIGAYIVRRLLLAVPVLLGATLIAFTLGVAAPGDPVREALAQNGALEPSPVEIEAMRTRLGLDRPFLVQYGEWLLGLVQGDLGASLISGQPVADELLRRLPVTLSLSLCAVVLAGVFGVSGGLLMGYCHGRLIDQAGRIVSLIILSMPGFWLALLLILLFAEHWKVLPTSGYGGIEHLVLPAAVLASGTMAVLARLTRSVMLEVMHQPYVTAARARGLSESVVVFRHIFRNMLVPIITVLGTYFGAILGGSVIVEVIFALPGIGRYAVDGIFRRDYPVIQGYVVLTALTFVTFNLLADLLCLWISPKTRVGGAVG